jgi:hypothetical protein
VPSRSSIHTTAFVRRPALFGTSRGAPAHRGRAGGGDRELLARLTRELLEQVEVRHRVGVEREAQRLLRRGARRVHPERAAVEHVAVAARLAEARAPPLALLEERARLHRGAPGERVDERLLEARPNALGALVGAPGALQHRVDVGRAGLGGRGGLGARGLGRGRRGGRGGGDEGGGDSE